MRSSCRRRSTCRLSDPNFPRCNEGPSGPSFAFPGRAIGQTGEVDERPCELCEAARLTEWYYEDEHCWAAECEACFVPMVVWKRHDPDPPEEVRAMLRNVLADVAARVIGVDYWFDDTLRSIPGHYHAHARPRGRGLG